MLEEALKLYLTYPAEMEYWRDRPDPVDEDDADAKEEAEDEERRDSYLLDLIAKGDKDSFLEALNRAYDSALEQFTESIARPIENKLLRAAQDEHLTLHKPNNRDYIADDWAWYVRAEEPPRAPVRVEVGCFFQIEKRPESGSGLDAYPWIWIRGRKRVENLTGKLGNEFCVPNEGSWDKGTIVAKSPIHVAPDDKAEDFVTQITNKLTPAMPQLARLVERQGSRSTR